MSIGHKNRYRSHQRLKILDKAPPILKLDKTKNTLVRMNFQFMIYY